jgi:RND family efflux transporter MFP subunit
MRLNQLIPVVIAGLFATSCTDQTADLVTEPAVRPVKLMTLNANSTETSARYPAVVAADRTANLSFPMSGMLEKLNVVEAQEVVKGEELAALETRDIVNKLASSRAQFENAEDEYQRGKRLFEQDALAKNAFEQRRVQRDVAKAQLDTAEKAFSDATIRAPFSGLVASVSADAQQTVQGGSTIITLIGVEELNATVNMPARVVAQAPERGDDLSAFITFDSVPGLRLPVEFKKATLIADAASQTYAVSFSFSRPEDMFLLPGMTATIEIIFPDQDDGAVNIAVPIAAISSDADSRYVWLVDPKHNTVSRRNVKIKDGIGELMVISSGLVTGDIIVGAGGAYLTEGMTVRQWADQTDHR